MPACNRSAGLTAMGLLTAHSCLALVLGCGGGPTEGTVTLPKTHPLVGKVYSQPGHVAANVTIEFTGNSKYSIVGTSLADGTIDIQTIVAGASAKGVPEGTYTVVVTPPNPSNKPEEQHMQPPPMQMPQPFTVKAGENKLDIMLSELVPLPEE